jgi:NADP-dependent 3-hydroxy acid dehydrogenase YdfG
MCKATIQTLAAARILVYRPALDTNRGYNLVATGTVCSRTLDSKRFRLEKIEGTGSRNESFLGSVIRALRSWEFNMSDRSIVVAGVGHASGVGAAVARRFAREGFYVTIFGRNAEKLETAEASLRKISDDVRVVVGDVTDENSIAALVVEADTTAAPLEVAIFNAGGNWPKRYLDMDAEFLETMWRVNALAGLFFSQAAVRAMLPRERGTIIFTGATGSMRGKTGFAGFASSKAALRMLAQSCAREFSPQGLHVAHVVIDGAVDGERINTLMPNLKQKLGEEGLLDPDAIAENYWNIHCQKRSAWTHELDVRPFSENW